MSERDIVNEMAGIAPGSPYAALRAERPEIIRHTEGAYQALLEPADPGSLSLAERAGVALAVAEHNADAALAAHYRGLAARPEEGPRWRAIRRHVDMMSAKPGSATPADVQTLRDAGLSEREIVTVAQLVAFVSYQARVLAGLRLLGEAA